MSLLSTKYSTSLNFAFKPITLIKLRTLIGKLAPNKSDQFGNLPTFIFIEFFKLIGPSLLNLINKSLSEGIYPDFLKLGVVTPPFKKKGSKLDISNYRPISVLPTLSKIFELVIHEQLYDHFEDNHLLSPEQFGFRRHKSTVQAVQQLLDNIYDAFEKKIPAISLHFDLSKAFDMINHELLLCKLKHYGLSCSALKLMKSYLSNRRQIVKLKAADGPVFSNKAYLNVGVPQGSILGPLLFIIFINDLPFSDLTTYLFADDTSLVLKGNNIIPQIIEAYTRITHWFSCNGLFVNEAKTQLLYYTLGRCSNLSSQLVKINDNLNLKFQDSAKFLGLVIDSALKWRTHVDHLLSKIQSQKWALRNLVKVVPQNSVLVFYHSCIMSHLRYGIILWGRSSPANDVFIEQKKIIRIMFNKPFNFHCKELFVQHGLFTIPSLYIFESIKFAINNNIIHRSDMESKHKYNSRHHHIDNARITLTTSEKNISYSAIQLFNALPLNLKLSFKNDQWNLFLNSLKKFCIQKAYYHLDEFLLDNNRLER